MGSQVMRQQHGLRPLQVRVARQVRGSRFVSATIEHIDQRKNASGGGRKLALGKQP